MAIAFDACTNSGVISGTSATFSHTTSGSNRTLIVAVRTLTSNDSVTAITYNGVSMTLVNSGKNQTSSNQNMYTYVYCLVNPASGSNTVSITQNVSRNIIAHAVSYTGTKQTSQPDGASYDSALGVTSITRTDGPSTVDNCWMLLYGVVDSVSGSVTISSGTGDVQRSDTGNVHGFYDSNGVAGSSSVQYTYTLNASGTCRMFVNVIYIAPSLELSRTPSDSILNGASRVATVAKGVTMLRMLSESILNGASRVATIAYIKGLQYTRTLSDSIMNAASRFATFVLGGTYSIWTSQSQHSATFTAQSQNNASFTTQTKNNANWISQNKS